MAEQETEDQATNTSGEVSSGMFGPKTTYDPGAALAQWVNKVKASESSSKPEPYVEPKAESPAKGDAPESKLDAEGSRPEAAKAAKSLAARLAGKEPDAKKPAAAEWDESATRALKRAGMRDEEVAEMQALSAEKPWFGAWLSNLQKVQAKQDADFAALKSGTREPTPGAQRPLAQEQGDQPGSGQVADLLETLTSKLGEELGDDNATLLRQAFAAQAQQIAELREQFGGYTRAANEERAAAEIEVMVQQSRSSLREEFPWIDDEARFEDVAREMAALRPDEINPDGVAASMRKAARIVFFDDVRADAKAVASKLGNQRKDRSRETPPTSAPHDDGPPLSDYELMRETMRMSDAGATSEQIKRFTIANQQKSLKARGTK